MTLAEELSQAEWLEPWEPLDEEGGRACEHRLARGLSPGHPLHGRSPQAVAERADDVADTLFLLSDPAQLCRVPLAHMAAAHGGELDLFDSFAEFREACMLPDHLEYSDDDV